MIAVLVAVAGIALLVWLAVLVGTVMDTRARRAAHWRIAEQRRRLREEQRTFVLRRCDPDELCTTCPFR